MSFVIATSIDQAVQALAQGARPIAGGSDLVVSARHGSATLPDQLIAIDRIAELGVIARDQNGVSIGAGVTHARLMTDAMIVESYSALADAAALVGSPATRNVGTLGGNIMNASPAMDTGAPLVVLGAVAELASATGTRHVPVGELWQGPGRTSARPDELCTGIALPASAPRSGSAYLRLEYRRAMEIAVVGAAASVTLDNDGVIIDAAVALAAVAPTIISVEAAPDVLVGSPLDEASLVAIAAAASERAAPISDLRASERYRRHTVGVMAKRAVQVAALRATGESVSVPANRSTGVGGPQ